MLREIISKRISRLKRAGVKTPILDEVALPAEIVSMSVVQSSLGWRDWLEKVRDWLFPPRPPPKIPKVPTIVKGLVHGEEAGRWYRVDFPELVKNAVVTANSNARVTDFLTRIIDRIPVVKIPGIPKIPDIPRVTRDDFNSAYYCDLVGAGARDRAWKMAPPWPLDIVWGWFCDALYWLFYAGWYVSGWILNVLWDSFIQSQIDEVRDSIHGQVDMVRGAVNDQVDLVTDAMNNQVGLIQDAVNARLADLLQMWGLPSTNALSAVMLRNVTDEGFEFLSLGNMDVWFNAIGDPE